MEANSCFDTSPIIGEPGIDTKFSKEIARGYSQIIPIKILPVKILPTSKIYIKRIANALNSFSS